MIVTRRSILLFFVALLAAQASFAGEAGEKGSSNPFFAFCMDTHDSKKRTLLKPTSASCQIPIILKKGAQVVSITGNVAQLMDLGDYSMFETEIPEDLKDKIHPGGEVEYWEIGNRKMIKQAK